MDGLPAVTSGLVTQWGDGYSQKVNMLHRLENTLKVPLGGLARGKLLREVLAMCCDLNGINVIDAMLYTEPWY